MKTTRRPSKHAIAVSLIAFVAVAGCGDKSVDTEPRKKLPHSGAPAVPKPLRTVKFEAEPCSILTVRDLAALGIKATDTVVSSSPPGPTCRYSNDDALTWGLTITLITADEEGLSRQYQNQKIDPAGYFQEVDPVGGYPGVLTGLVDDREDGNCELIIGVRNDRTMQVILSGTSTKDPCDAVTEIGKATVTRIAQAN